MNIRVSTHCWLSPNNLLCTADNPICQMVSVSAKHLLLQWCKWYTLIHRPLDDEPERYEQIQPARELLGVTRIVVSVILLLLSTIREVSSFSCWLLNLDKVGRLLLILSGRYLEIFGNRSFMTTNYNQNSARYMTGKNIWLRKVGLWNTTYMSILSAIALRTEELRP